MRKLTMADELGLVGTKAASFFKNKAFFVTGLLEQDILKDAQLVLFNALKGDKPERTVMLELDQALAPYLPDVNAAGAEVNVPARLEVIARTNLAEAMSEGRFATFTDPELPEGFVYALQHSAILDDRVRDSHRAMDGVTLPPAAWLGPPDRRPPGSWNCRCVLIPLSIGDEVPITPESQIPRNYPDPKFR